MADTVSVVKVPGVITTVTTPEGEIVTTVAGGQRGLTGAPGLPVDILATAPASPTEGYTYYNTTDHKLWYWNGTAWVDGSASADASTLQGQNGAYYKSRDNHTGPSASKATPVDADNAVLLDSAASGIAKKLSWANIKATLKAYFDTVYAPIAGAGAVWGAITGTLSAQTDLQAALDAKVNDTGDTMTGPLTVNASTSQLTLKNGTKRFEAFLDSAYKVIFGHDYAASDNVQQYEFKFYSTEGYPNKGLKLSDVGLGTTIIMHAAGGSPNSVYFTQADGSPAGFMLTTLANPIDGTLIQAGFGQWTCGAKWKVPDDTYAAGWNGDTSVPTKNAIYDKIESMAIQSKADSAAANNELYFSTDVSKLSYKDPGGVVNRLY